MKNLSHSKGAWTRLALLLLAVFNQTLVMMGYNPLPFLPEDIETLIGLVFLFLTGFASWWKDNDVTEFAKFRKKIGSEEIKIRLDAEDKEDIRKD